MEKYLPFLVEFCAAIQAEPHLLQSTELKFFRDCMHEHLSVFVTSSDEDEEAPPADQSSQTIIDLRDDTRLPCMEDIVANPVVVDMARHMMNNPQLMQQMLGGMTSDHRR